MCAISLCASRIGLGWAHDVLTLHVTCSCIFYAFVRLFTYSYYCELFWDFSNCFFFSLSLLLVTLVVSMAPKRKSTPARNPFHSSASSSSDHAPLSLSVSVMMMPTRHLRKTFLERLSFGTPSHFGSFCWHLPSHCHSQSRMGVSLWQARHLSSRVDSGVLLQHAWDWLLRTLFHYSCPRYFYSYHFAACCRCA